MGAGDVADTGGGDKEDGLNLGNVRTIRWIHEFGLLFDQV
jgi:hypothetical protein